MSGPLMRNESRTVIFSGPVCHSEILEFYPIGSNDLSDI